MIRPRRKLSAKITLYAERWGVSRRVTTKLLKSGLSPEGMDLLASISRSTKRNPAASK